MSRGVVKSLARQSECVKWLATDPIRTHRDWRVLAKELQDMKAAVSSRTKEWDNKRRINTGTPEHKLTTLSLV